MSRIFARDAALSTGLRFGQLAGPQRRLVSLFDLMEYFPLGPFAEEFLRTRVMLGGIAAPETSQEVREANAADLRGRMANLRDFLARFGFVASHHNSVLMVAAVNMPNVDQNWALQAAKRLEE